MRLQVRVRQTDDGDRRVQFELRISIETHGQHPLTPFLSPCLLSVPRLILTSRTGTPKLHHPIQPAFVMLPSEKALLLSRLCLLVHQRIRRMHCLARYRVRHLRQTEIRSQLLRGKEACDVAGFSAFSHEKKHKIGDNSEDRSRCRRRRRPPHVSARRDDLAVPGGAWSPGRRRPRHWIVGGCFYHPLTEQQQEE